MSGKSEWLDCSECCFVGSQPQDPAFIGTSLRKPFVSQSSLRNSYTQHIRRYILIYLSGLGYFTTIIYTMRTRPDVCERVLRCPNPALIYYAFSDNWLCSYCVGDTRMRLPLCTEDGWRRGSCVDTESQQWFCDSHADRCEAIVGRPQGQSTGNSHRCMRVGTLYESNQLGRFYCTEHMPDNQGLHDTESAADVAISPPTISKTLNLDIFSTVVDTECCICLEPQRSMRRLIACNHMFCEDCLSKQVNGPYARAHNRPLCRKDIFDLIGTD